MSDVVGPPIPSDPAFLLPFGIGGTFKSTQAAALAAAGGVAFALPTGMEPLKSWLGVQAVVLDRDVNGETYSDAWRQHVFGAYIPAAIKAGIFVIMQPKDISQALGWLPWLRAAGVWCVVFDDLSLFASDVEQDLRAKAAAIAVAQKNSKGPDTRKVYGELKEVGVHLRRAIIDTGLTVVVNAHEKVGEDGKGRPEFPGSGLRDQLVYSASVVVRTASDPEIWGARRMAYRTSALWEGKNRLTPGGAPSVAPANLRALLTDTGRTIPRVRGLEWQDGVMYGVCEALVAGDSYPSLVQKYVEWGEAANLNPAHVSWAIHDGYALSAYALHRLGGRNYMSALLAGGPPTLLPGVQGTPAIPPPQAPLAPAVPTH